MFKKSIVIILTATGLLSCASKKNPSATNISGLWTDVNSSDFKNCYVVIAQDGEKIIMNHYLEFKGDGMVEYGIGKIDGEKVVYDVVVTKAISGWATKGKHVLVLNKERDTLKGTYQDAKGNSGALVFKKIK
jgi:hypothetical protein